MNENLKLKHNINPPQFKDDGCWPDKMVYEIYHGDNLEDLPWLILKQMNNHLQSIIDSKMSIMKYVQSQKEKKDSSQRIECDTNILINDENIIINISHLSHGLILFSINEYNFSILNNGHYALMRLMNTDQSLNTQYNITLNNIVHELKEWYKISESANVEIKVSNDVTTDNSIASTFIQQPIPIRDTNE